jgi:hypothetical protein
MLDVQVSGYNKISMSNFVHIYLRILIVDMSIVFYK